MPAVDVSPERWLRNSLVTRLASEGKASLVLWRMESFSQPCTLVLEISLEREDRKLAVCSLPID
jgi:hypothetical protein